MTQETQEFKAEVKQILDLVIHSLYSHKEVFLRELISNASDAIDRAKYESLTNPDIHEDNGDWHIRITADPKNNTLTVSDNGIGMNREEIVEALGTIARSGTREYLMALKNKDVKDNPELIGQFGVGFYSSFMVADKITVISKRAGEKNGKAVKWESTGDGSFAIDETDKKGKGTDITLHLREEEKRYLDEWVIRDTIKKYSDFIEHPILMEVERRRPSEIEKSQMVTLKEDETLNSRKAPWLRDKSEISQEEYKEFYKHISHDFMEPIKTIHYRAEGTSEFAALLYVPSRAPSNIFFKDYKVGPALYVKRVQIMEHCEDLIPTYLRFIRGVVDSSDLPLNVSREILQQNKQMETIRNSITRKVLDALEELRKDDFDTYLTFYKEFGRILKEGIYVDHGRAEAIADLLLFPSTRSKDGGLRTFDEYVTDMKEGQEEIYFIAGSSLEEALNSPHLEAFADKDYEVLVMLDEIDDIVMTGFEYKEKKLKSVTRGEIKLKTDEAAEHEKTKKEYAQLVDFMKEQLKDYVKDVRMSARLKDSPCCLVSEEGDLDPQTAQFLKAMGQPVPESKRVLEVNGAHRLLKVIERLFEKDQKSAQLARYIGLLYDEALLLEGSKPRDPVEFARTISDLMVEQGEERLSVSGDG
ncbi:MAG TPA: molecular chaperone HtpG [Deltaproteobacteria bacterium]|nr:molecular chaperone HtpG [Deltaproteobacteria bacterium]